MSNTPVHCCRKCGKPLSRSTSDIWICTTLKCLMRDILVYITLPLKARHG